MEYVCIIQHSVLFKKKISIQSFMHSSKVASSDCHLEGNDWWPAPTCECGAVVVAVVVVMPCGATRRARPGAALSSWLPPNGAKAKAAKPEEL